MDTGLGRDGYSMIGQGKIDSIISSKSQERRDIFEEASGITKYKYRKAESEKKLLQTDENLTRIKKLILVAVFLIELICFVSRISRYDAVNKS